MIIFRIITTEMKTSSCTQVWVNRTLITVTAATNIIIVRGRDVKIFVVFQDKGVLSFDGLVLVQDRNCLHQLRVWHEVFAARMT